jgi:ferredoxin-NADP reductase
MPELDMRLVYSVRYPDDVIYADEIGAEAALTYTREAPQGWSGHTGHIDAGLLRAPADGAQLAFVCGSNGFVETASELLLELGMEPGTIRTERFGPTD